MTSQLSTPILSASHTVYTHQRRTIRCTCFAPHSRLEQVILAFGDGDPMSGEPADWRQPRDAFAAQLASARDVLLCSRANPSVAVVPFEPIIEELKYDRAACEAKLPRVRALGRDLLSELRAAAGPVAMEVRHYCWHLQHLGELSSLTDVLMVTLTQFAHFAGHVPERCEVCAEFPGDIPFQGAPGGRDHYHEWLRQRGG